MKLKKLIFTMLLILTFSTTAIVVDVNAASVIPGNVDYNTPGMGEFEVEMALEVTSGNDYSLDIYLPSGYLINTVSYTLYSEFKASTLISETQTSRVSNNTITIPGGNDRVVLVVYWLVEGDAMGFDMEVWGDIQANLSDYIDLSDEIADEIPPTYSYSSAEVNTPYYDLVTEAEIRTQLTATDPEEGSVTDRIQVYEDQYTSESKVVGGDYFIMYVVDDTSGNSAYLQIDINVIDDRKPYATYNSTTYQDGSSLSLSWYDDDTAVEQLTLAEIEDLFLFNDENYNPGELTINTTCSGYDQTAPGNYAVNVSITDPSSNTSNITVNVTVNANDDPVITGPSAIDVEVTSVNISQIISDNFSASDTEDGSLSVIVDGSNTWNYNTPALGTFTLTLSATDSMGAETLKSVSVNVEDTTAGTFKIDNIPVTTYTHILNMSDTSTLQTLIDSIVVYDTWHGDITSNMVVPAFPSFAVPGSTDMTLTCDDGSGNIATLVLTVVVTDDIAPVINGATKIVKGLTGTLTLSNVTAELTATDNVDGIITVEVVSDGYTGNSSVLGSYIIQYKATDSSGNISYHDVRVWVVDNQVPVWVLNDFFVNITANQAMTRTELVSLLQASGMIGSDISYTVTFVTDEYSGNEAIEGAYSVVMNVVYEDGSEDSISVQLNVPDLTDDDTIVVEQEEDLTGFQKAIEWIKTAWSNIGQWFSNRWQNIKDGFNWVKNNVWIPVRDFFTKVDEDPDIPVYTTTEVDTQTTTTEVVTLPGGATTDPILNQV